MQNMSNFFITFVRKIENRIAEPYAINKGISTFETIFFNNCILNRNLTFPASEAQTISFKKETFNEDCFYRVKILSLHKRN